MSLRLYLLSINRQERQQTPAPRWCYYLAGLLTGASGIMILTIYLLS